MAAKKEEEEEEDWLRKKIKLISLSVSVFSYQFYSCKSLKLPVTLIITNTIYFSFSEIQRIEQSRANFETREISNQTTYDESQKDKIIETERSVQ